MLPCPEWIPSSGIPVPANMNPPNSTALSCNFPTPSSYILSPVRKFQFLPIACRKRTGIKLHRMQENVTLLSQYYKFPPISSGMKSRSKAGRSHGTKAVVHSAILRLHRPIQHWAKLLIRLDVPSLPTVGTLPRRPFRGSIS